MSTKENNGVGHQPTPVVEDSNTNNSSNTPKRTFEVVEIVDPSNKNKDEKSNGNIDGGVERASLRGKTIPLYEDEADTRPMVASILSRLVDYSSTVQNVSAVKSPSAKDATNKTTPKPSKPTKKPELGTLVGVYLPTIQNIFGVLLFLRLAWMVGTAGILQTFGIVFVCCSCTMLTAISMSAIATNGYVPAGGSYFMISRALGPECGGAVGVLFFIGTSFAAAMYIIGAVEILLTYIAPEIAIFRPIGNSVEGVSTQMLNNMRVYGTIFLLSMATLVFVGVKYVNKLAGVFLACVITSILCIYIGFFTTRNVEPRVCIITSNVPGMERPAQTLISLSGEFSKYECSFNSTTSLKSEPLDIYDMYCHNRSVEVCYEEFPFLNGDVQLRYGIPGITSGEFFNNLGSFYRLQGEVVPNIKEEIASKTASVKADITTSAMILTGIFFPSCTGIMAGSNRSGDLRNAGASIPVGTIAAIVTTSIVYLSSVILFGSVSTGALLRDKYGASIGGELMCAMIAFPSKYVVLFGAFFSTVGAGLQSLTGAPRLLQAIARDDIIPPLKYFAKGKSNGEPSWALLLAAAIAEVGILIASVDSVAPIITIFFLMCYLFVNLACAVQTLLRSPNWRPTFRFYHWGLSLLGMGLCVFLMFVANWWQALMAMLIALGLYKYIEYAGAKKEWGDGIRGLSLSAALYGLRRLEDLEVHTKNWRPQILALVTQNEDVSEEHIQAGFPFPFIGQLKAGKGLTIVGSIIQGRLTSEKYREKDQLIESITTCMQKNKVKGFSQISISESLLSGYLNMLQLSGLGCLKPNTVLMNWPKEITDEKASGNFTQEAILFSDVLHAVASGKQHVFIAMKNQHNFPSNKEIQSSNATIDIWWIVHDGGILMLLGFLLRQHKVWRQTTTRIFTVAQPEDNSIKIKKDLLHFLSLLRIEATVDVIEMPNDDISAYTYEKTLIMEQRNKLLENLNMTRRESKREVQVLTDTRRHKFSVGSQSQQPQISTCFEDQSTDDLMSSNRPAPPAVASASTVVGNNSVPPPFVSFADSHTTHPGDMGVGDTPSNGGILRFCVTKDVSEDENKNESVVDVEHSPLEKIEEAILHPDDVKTQKENGLLNIPQKNNLSLSTHLKPDEKNVKAMDAAEKLNKVVVEKSSQSKLVFINLPAPPQIKNPQTFYNYFQFVESMVKDLEMPIILVRGSGREFVTIYS